MIAVKSTAGGIYTSILIEQVLEIIVSQAFGLEACLQEEISVQNNDKEKEA